MWKSRLQILYYLGLLYLVLRFQDKACSRFPLLGISTDIDYNRLNAKIVTSNFHFSMKCENSGDLSSTNPSASYNKAVPSSMNGLSSNMLCVLASRPLFEPASVITVLLSSGQFMEKVGNVGLFILFIGDYSKAKNKVDKKKEQTHFLFGEFNGYCIFQFDNVHKAFENTTHSINTICARKFITGSLKHDGGTQE
ncbi:hypothetical protein ACROYT_G025432 [Oculina patagonica]